MNRKSDADSRNHGGHDDGGHHGALRAIARGGSANAGGALLGAVASFLLIVLIARWWTPAEAGLLFAATSVFMIAIGLCQLGVDQGLVRFLAWNIGRGDAADNRYITLRAALPVLGVAVFVAVIGWFAALPIQQLLGYSQDSEETLFAIRALAVTLPIAVLYEQLLAITRGYSHMRPTVVVERILRPCLQVLCVVAAAHVAPTISYLALAWVGPYYVCVVLAAIAAWGTLRRMSREGAGAQHEPGLMREFWSFTAPRGVARLAQLGIQRADIVIVSILAGPSAAAVYTSTTRFLVLGQMVINSLQQVSEPQLAKLLSAGKLSGAAAVVRQMTLWSTLLGVPLYLTIAIHAGPLLGWMFGPTYESGALLLRLLCIAMIIGVCCGPVDVLLLMAGRSTLSLINVSVALAVDIALCLLLVPSLSYLGAGIAWAIAVILKNGLACIQVWRNLGVSAFTWQQGRWAVLATLLFGVVPGLVAALTTSSIVPIVVSIVIGVGYLLWIWVRREGLLNPDA